MPNELYHHGINGQRWGFRRFQNEDGSLTPEGELRYNQGKQKLARGKAAEMYKTKKYKAQLALKTKKQEIKNAGKEARAIKKEQLKVQNMGKNSRGVKKTKDMTDEELKKEIERLGMEIDYNKKAWQAMKKEPSMLDKANDFFESPTGRIVGQLGSNIIQNVATTTLNRMIEEKTGVLKKQQIANSKKLGEQTQTVIDRNKQDAANAQKLFDAEYEKTYGTSSKDTKSNDSPIDTALNALGGNKNTKSNNSPIDTALNALGGNKNTGGQKSSSKNTQSQTKAESKSSKSKSYGAADALSYVKNSKPDTSIFNAQTKATTVNSFSTPTSKYWAYQANGKDAVKNMLSSPVSGSTAYAKTDSSSNFWDINTGKVKHSDEDEEEIIQNGSNL